MDAENQFKDFLRKQEAVYRKFEAAREKVLTDGTKPHNLNGKGGYLIMLRHDKDIISRVDELSAQINDKYIKSLRYGESNVHTTIADADIRDNFQPDISILNDLAGRVQGLIFSHLDKTIVYTSFLVNQDTIIARGVPSHALWDLMQDVNYNLASCSVKPRAEWGTHITVARFSENVQEPKCKELVEYLDSALPIGESKPIAIDIGYFNVKCDEFDVKTFERFNLPR